MHKRKTHPLSPAHAGDFVAGLYTLPHQEEVMFVHLLFHIMDIWTIL